MVENKEGVYINALWLSEDDCILTVVVMNPYQPIPNKDYLRSFPPKEAHIITGVLAGKGQIRLVWINNQPVSEREIKKVVPDQDIPEGLLAATFGPGQKGIPEDLQTFKPLPPKYLRFLRSNCYPNYQKQLSLTQLTEGLGIVERIHSILQAHPDEDNLWKLL